MEPNGMDTTLDNALRERLIEDLKLVMEDAQDVLRNTSEHAGERLRQARVRLESTLANARDNFSIAEKHIVETTRNAVETADAYVQRNPWQAVGVGLAAGLAVGLLFGKRG